MKMFMWTVAVALLLDAPWAMMFGRDPPPPRAGSLVRFADKDGIARVGIMRSRWTAEVFAGESVLSPGESTGTLVQLAPEKLLSPLDARSVPAVYGIGCNYLGHCCRAGEKNCSGPTLPNPEHLTIFFKNRNTINRPYGDVPVPLGVNATDYEAELGVVIGKDCKDVRAKDALECVHSYVALNDVSNRWLQTTDNGQWSFSKSFDGHCPIGPGAVPKHLLGDGSGLGLRLLLNGNVKQSANTSDLIFNVRKTIAFISKGTTIEKGTLIAMGTPPGTGQGIVQVGDEMCVELDGVGSICSKVVQA